MSPWQILVGALIVAGAIAGGLLSGGPPAALAGYGILALAGVIVIVQGMRPGEEEPESTVELIDVSKHGLERRSPLLETARRLAMIAGASSAVIAATWFRFALYDDDFGATEWAAIMTFVVGAALFGRAYWVGTTPREMPPKTDLWDRVVAWIEDHGAVVALLGLTIASGVMFAGVFVAESIGDDLTFHMAESARLADCIREGDWDFWNPSANGGFASLYYYQAIPQLASAIPTALFGNHLFWFQLSLWLPLVIVPVCAYRGIRLMGATPWQSVAAALCVTFISGASRWGSGADGSFQVGLYTQTWALAFFPLGLGHGVRYLLEGKGLPAAIAWGALVFLCHPFASIALCLGLAVGVLAHYLQFPVKRANLKVILLALLGLGFVLCFAAILVDRPTPPASAPDTPVPPIRIIYVAPLILFGGLIARVALAGKRLSLSLLAGVALAFGANVIGFLVMTVIPKRPEGATQDLPPEWQFGAASAYIGPLLLIAALIGRLVLQMRRPEPEEPGPSNGPRLFACAAILAVAIGVFLFGALRGSMVVAGAAVLPFGAFLYLAWPVRHEPLIRLVVIGACLAVATMPGWLTVIVDRDGFGGFPHRVADEVGPGYKELSKWYTRGSILDHNRIAILTWALPVVLAFGRMKFGRWLWAPALTFAALLALGPHAPKTADDLLPAVRFLGAMQVVLAMAIGAGAFATMRMLWDARVDSWPLAVARAFAGRRRSYSELLYGVRTVVIAVTCALVIFVALMGSKVLSNRVSSLAAFDYRDEMFQMIDLIEQQPQGKKQVGNGCENHWWNMLSYVYAKRPSLLQMGGGGLQASPNYDFVYSVRDFPKLAWVYDVPLFLYAKASGGAPDGEVLGATERYELRRLPAPGPVSPIQITGVLPAGESRANSEVRKAAIEWLKSSDPLSDHHLAYFGYGGLFQAPDATVIRAFRVDPSPGELADFYADVDVKQPSTFVARESWHPRWHAYIDGEEVPVRRVTPDFPAIDVPVGKHQLAFRFERPWWAHASWLAWPGITLGAWWLLRRLRRKTQLPTARVVDG